MANMAHMNVPANMIPMRLAQVNIAIADATFRSTKGILVNIPPGEHVDIMQITNTQHLPVLGSEYTNARSSRLLMLTYPDLAVLRSREHHHVVLPSAIVSHFTCKLAGSLFTPTGTVVNTLAGELEVQRLLHVKQDFIAYGETCRLVILKAGHEVLLFRTSFKEVCEFRTCNGRVFFLAESDIEGLMDELDPERDAIQRVRSAGVAPFVDSRDMSEGPWNDHLPNQTGQWPAQPAAAGLHPVYSLPQSKERLPMPPSDYCFSLKEPMNGQSDFGHWKYSSEEDKLKALAKSFHHPSMVVYAAHCGQAGLSAIKLEWVPGQIEGSQGSRLGPTNAYIHLFIIQERCRFWFGIVPVEPYQLPVYTGTDMWWPGRKGANAAFLDSVKHSHAPPTNNNLCEEDIMRRLCRRQGYKVRERYERQPLPRGRPRFSSNAAQDAWPTVLSMCDLGMALSYPLVNSQPIEANRPLDGRTAFHSATLTCGHEGAMPAINYLIRKPSDMPALEVLKRRASDGNRTCFARLNADGEAMYTMIRDSSL